MPRRRSTPDATEPLFGDAPAPDAPLAARMRPRSFEEFVGRVESSQLEADRARDEQFWTRYQRFGATAEAYCRIAVPAVASSY